MNAGDKVYQYYDGKLKEFTITGEPIVSYPVSSFDGYSGWMQRREFETSMSDAIMRHVEQKQRELANQKAVVASLEARIAKLIDAAAAAEDV